MMKKMMVLVLLVLALLGAAAYADDTLYVQGDTADRVHLRLDPSTDSNSLGLYFTGTPVTRLLEIATGWTQVRIGAETGYIKTSLLSEDPVAMAAPVYEVYSSNGGRVNLRSGPRSRASVIGQMEPGTLVYVLGETATGWYYVDAGDASGYMMKDYLRLSEVQQIALPVQIVGMAADGMWIQQLQAPNGQLLYFTSMEEEPVTSCEDVNFDGVPDIVVTIAAGASNCFNEFFVWDGTQYTAVRYPGGGGLPNYRLDPQRQLLCTYANNGYAGALSERCIYRWEGSTLRLVRRALADNLAVTEFRDDAMVTTIYSEMLQVTVWAHTAGVDETILLEQVVHMDEFDTEIVDAALWQGL